MKLKKFTLQIVQFNIMVCTDILSNKISSQFLFRIITYTCNIYRSTATKETLHTYLYIFILNFKSRLEPKNYPRVTVSTIENQQRQDAGMYVIS